MCRVPISALALTLLTAGLRSQNPLPNPRMEPQYNNVFYGIAANGNLIDLERETVTFRSKVKALPGYATVKMIAELKPGHSGVRISPDAAQFVVRGRAPTDPSSRFELWRLKTSGNHRELVITQGHGSILGGSAKSKLDENAVALRFEDYGANSYRITPATQQLGPGEYALALRGMVSDLYCFGVDRISHH